MENGSAVTTRGVSLALGASEQRVLGCLLEKHRTTPDAYPLSLNALRLACNQSTNRDPVVDYDEAVIRDALHRLERKGLVRLASGAGSRAAKYRHLLAEVLPMGRGEEAVVCVLLLRGPQTPGELKQRTDRMHPFSDLGELGVTLQELIQRGLVARMGRRPGQKEERYAHLLGGVQEHDGTRPLEVGAPAPAEHGYASAVDASAPADGAGEVYRELPHEPPSATAAPDGLAERVSQLEREVAGLRERLAALTAELGVPE
ncbi:MAG TPA: YceH family protein [Solirubrobacteraceae bacterium]|nr:YceH family protein [Solirubrobacteraceae bacterium]